MLKQILFITLLVCPSFSCAPTLLSRSALRSTVAPKVYLLEFGSKKEGVGGRGTGFSVQAPSGKSYIVTNGHVCDGALDHKLDMYVTVDGFKIKRNMIKVSDETDLCIVEGLPAVKGLKVGSSFKIGDWINTVGFPGGGPQTMSGGEINDIEDSWFIRFVIRSEEDVKRCNLPKNAIKFEDGESVLPFLPPERVRVCVVGVMDSTRTTAFAKPGSSGSPAVNDKGEVIGVVFATDQNNWANLVSLKDLQNFLKPY